MNLEMTQPGHSTSARARYAAVWGLELQAGGCAMEDIEKRVIGKARRLS
jgi:hypothetical protein